MKKLIKKSFMFLVGGTVYYGIELLFRGYSHPTMFILGGLCFLICGLMSRTVPKKTGLLARMFLCSVAITTLELLFGYIFNIKLGLCIWNYECYSFNYKGQICLVFSVLWYALSGLAIIGNDYLCYYLFGGPRPHYEII